MARIKFSKGYAFRKTCGAGEALGSEPSAVLESPLLLASTKPQLPPLPSVTEARGTPDITPQTQSPGEPGSGHWEPRNQRCQGSDADRVTRN